MKKYQANLGLLMCALIWGTGFIATDIAFESYTPMQVQFLRFGIAAVLLFIFIITRKEKINFDALKVGSIMGLVFFVAYSFQSYGMEITTPSKNAFFTNTNVIFVPIIMLLYFKVKITKRFFIGLLAILFGYFLIIFTFNIFDLRSSFLSLQANLTFNFGDFLTIIGALGFALHIVLTSIYSHKYKASELLFAQMLVSTIGSLIIMLFEKSTLTFIPVPFMLCLYMAIFSSIIAYGGQIIFQKYTEASPAAIILSLESPFAAMFSILLAREIFFNGLIVGGIFVVIGIILIESNIGAGWFKKKNNSIKN